MRGYSTVLLQLVAPPSCLAPPCANLYKWRLKKKCKFLPWNSLKRVATHLELHYFVYWPFARRSKMFSNLLLCLMSFWYHSIVHAYTPAHPSSSLFFPILFQELFVLRWSKVFSETLIEVIFGAWNVFSIEGTFNFLKLNDFWFTNHSTQESEENTKAFCVEWFVNVISFLFETVNYLLELTKTKTYLLKKLFVRKGLPIVFHLEQWIIFWGTLQAGSQAFSIWVMTVIQAQLQKVRSPWF